MAKSKIAVHPMALSGKTVVLTGTLEKLTRKKAEELVEKAGGHLTDSVTKNTSLIIASEKAARNLTWAKEFNIEIISEGVFLERIKKDPGFNPEVEGYFELVAGKNEWVKFDEMHSGELWFTQANQEKYDAGEEEIDWEEYRAIDGKLVEWAQEYFDKGYRYVTYTGCIAAGEVVDQNGNQIRLNTEEDTLIANDIDPAAYHATGCELMGSWCDG